MPCHRRYRSLLLSLSACFFLHAFPVSVVAMVGPLSLGLYVVRFNLFNQQIMAIGFQQLHDCTRMKAHNIYMRVKG